MGIRDFDTLNFQRPFLYPVHDSFGDQDPPAWWWLSNKTRYLWFGGHSTDSSRGNMYFGSGNELSGDQVKENEGLFEDVHQWSLAVEAPAYPGPIDTALAEQGAVLFHEKNLWADGRNADIPRPKGNVSCASCHGAYSPRYIHGTRFLPTPALAGMVGYTVPIEIVDTDPAQATGWSREIREHVSTFWWSYPDARPTIWRRVRSTTPVHFNQFETRLSAYDHDRLGWRYETIVCGDGGAGIPYYSCQPAFEAPETAIWLADTLLGGLLWPTWLVPPPVGTSGLEDRMIFNTNMYSKKNKGHEWTRVLSERERVALIEYLKTL